MNEPRSIKYIIPGDPIPLYRARFGGNKNVWDPQKEIKLVTSITLVSQHNDQPLFSGPVHLDIHFFFLTPKRKQYFNHQWHIYRPDLSNLIKFYEDISTSIIFKDDCLIAKISADKSYDLNPRTEFIITEIR